jgi:hypothetical protein
MFESVSEWLRRRKIDTALIAWRLDNMRARINRNSLAQFWAKRPLRYILKTGLTNRRIKRVEAAKRRHLMARTGGRREVR